MVANKPCNLTTRQIMNQIYSSRSRLWSRSINFITPLTVN